MKCPRCKTPLEEGSIYCHHCLQEIQWVSEYNTVETLMQKETKRQMLDRQKKHLEGLQKKKHPMKWMMISGFIAVCACIFWCVDHSYLIHYSLAQQAYRDKDYDRALGYADKALTISPGKGKAVILLSEVLREKGDLSGAVKVMEGNLKGHEDSPIYYEQLIALYEEAKEPEKIKSSILQADRQTVRREFDHYLCKDPKIQPETGTYDEGLEISIEVEEGVTYRYTLDGSQPTKESALYHGPIRIGDGVTEIYVVGENMYGIMSDVIYRKYTVIPEEPGAPEVMPDSGSYDKDTEIIVEVPDGFKAYYAFDGQPTENSTEYRAPVKMPVGEHTFCVILVGVNGRISEVASRYYYMDG